MSVLGIQEGATVSFDTSPFIYYLEMHPQYEARATELFTALQAGVIRGCTSVLVLAELLVPDFRRGASSEARALAATIRTYTNLHVLPVDSRIAERAAELRARWGLRVPDAIHAATALEAGAEWLVTNDRGLRRLEAEGLRVWLFDGLPPKS